MRINSNQLLQVYSGVLTAALAVAMLGGAGPLKGKVTLDELTVQRINVVGQDGRPRLILANRERMPGLIRNGAEVPHKTRKAAGMLFYNEEGAELGGLIFGGQKGPDGKVEQGGSLTFDQYNQDQVVQFTHQANRNIRYSGLAVFDRPVARFDPDAELKKNPGLTREQIVQKADAEGKYGGPRMFAGAIEGTSLLRLYDPKGKIRLVMRVNEKGDPAIEFLDEAEKVVRTITPSA
jgi:hypothetical protein